MCKYISRFHDTGSVKQIGIPVDSSNMIIDIAADLLVVIGAIPASLVLSDIDPNHIIELTVCESISNSLRSLILTVDTGIVIGTEVIIRFISNIPSASKAAYYCKVVLAIHLEQTGVLRLTGADAVLAEVVV